MKKTTLFIVTVLTVLSFVSSTTYAIPIGDSNSGMDYFVAAKDLGHWSAGLYIRGTKRNVDAFGQKRKLKSSTQMVYLGYSILSWLTPYVTGGTNKTRMQWEGQSDVSTLGAGIHLNILDHMILDPTLVEDRIRISGVVQYTSGKGDWDEDSADLSELHCSLKASIVNDIEGNKFYVPNSIALFGGPTYSTFLGNDIDENRNFGFTVGIDVYHSENVSFSIGWERYKYDGYNIGVHVFF